MATSEMGEVDEILSNEGNIKDASSMNGEILDTKDIGSESSGKIVEEDDESSDSNEEASNDSKMVDAEVLEKLSNAEPEMETMEIEEVAEIAEEENSTDSQQQEIEEPKDVENPEGTSKDIEDSEETSKDVEDPEETSKDVEDLEETSKDVEDNEESGKHEIVNGLDSSDDIIETSSVKNDSCEDVFMIEDKEDPIGTDSQDPIDSSEGNAFEDIEENENSMDQSNTEVISIDDSPKKKKRDKTDSGPPRRSSRHLNKERKSYVEEDEELIAKQPAVPKENEKEESEESDIEEVLPQDPLAVADPAPPVEKPKKLRMSGGSTIVVKDTKCLAEIASKSTVTNNKKEPTLVIIDTNSILSGRGPVPLAQKSSPSISNSYSMLPIALPAQGVYPTNMRATITPIPMTPAPTPAPPPPPKPQPQPPPVPQTLPNPVLPTLTDDMFVVEAPSFIVPYVYEKPPLKNLKNILKGLEKEIAEEIAKAEKEEMEKGEENGETEDDDKEKTSEDDDEKEKESGEKEKVDKDSEKENEKENEANSSLQVAPPSTLASELRKASNSYFDSPLGKFFMGIGYNLVQEAVQTDLLKQQKRKRDREGGLNGETNKTIHSLIKNLEYTKENNEPYHMEIKKCEFCSFRTESKLAMAYHLETPHMKNFIYRCNFCSYEVRSPHDILFHMEVQHGVRGRLERAPAFHQCPNCPFEDNQKGKLSRHLMACSRKFKPERNLEPPVDFEPPAKIPRAPRMKQQGLSSAAAVYQAMARPQFQMMSKIPSALPTVMQRGRGRPSLGTTVKSPSLIRQINSTNMIYKQANMSGGSVLVPTSYHLSGNQVYQQQATTISKVKSVQQPSISITPLPRTTAGSGVTITKPGDSTSNSKNSFVICEICDGYIKDLEQLRNHMQWIHKVKIHPKMIYNRPPLNCQKCQFRFFTDQGLERHLLGSHGLVTSSMQEAANRSKDAGRCPVCGRVYQWKLLNHVARDHNMTLKPAHLSYKCTVCTATFGMYKQFESHVYSAHSVVAKRVMDKKNVAASSSNKSETVLKPLKINDEITIIPQPSKPTNGAGGREETPSTSGTSITTKNNVGYSNGNPSTSKNESNEKNEPSSSTSLSRSERLSRRKTIAQDN